tara:strand:+ start:628 stop:996 length:369 start_codon:yes stop_codon:yes gene_type:complete
MSENIQEIKVDIDKYPLSMERKELNIAVNNTSDQSLTRLLIKPLEKNKNTMQLWTVINESEKDKTKNFKCIKENEITFCEMDDYIQDKTFTILKHIYSSKDETKIRENLVNFHCYLNQFKIT